MDTPPPVRASRCFPPMFWLTIAFLAPASILRLVTIQASWWCIDDASFSKGEVLALLVFGYALLLSLVWLFRTIPPALAVVAVGTVVITWLELWTALTVGIHWTAYCGEASVGSGLFAMLQDVAAVFVGVLACAAWLYHRSRSRPRSGTITELWEVREGSGIRRRSGVCRSCGESVRLWGYCGRAWMAWRSIEPVPGHQKICEDKLKGKYRIEVVDLLEQPQQAKGDQIIAIPTLVRKLPPPVKSIIGNLSKTESVLVGLNLQSVR